MVVVGGGHAGAEAALAAARMGARTACVVLDPAAIGRMSCNPAIGGIAKGQLVREIDALGGEMGLCADAAGIQFRMLNTSKGPAVRSPRAQCDRSVYNREMSARVQSQPGLTVIAGEVAEVAVEGDSAARRVRGVVLADGAEILAPAVVLTTGTFLGGKLFAGDWEERGGRFAEAPATHLSQALLDLGLRLGRHKTGTPPRLDSRSIDYSDLVLQPGDIEPVPFSFRTERLDLEQLCCHVTRTTAATHAILAKNAHRSPMTQGRIKGPGPRYCPSIEDKIVRFPDKDEHLIFLEPEGRGTYDVYPNGISTSLPVDVQMEFLRTIPGLEQVEMTQQGYAVEYDYLETDQLRFDLHVASLRGLFAAGQINGTSGYEEAAAQGLVAGVNAVRFARSEPPFVLTRASAYIGVMIDDLCRVNPDEPYRMFTSRAEFRLMLRSDNADRRLAPLAEELGLLDAGICERVVQKEARIKAAVGVLESSWRNGKTMAAYLRRPEVRVEEVLGLPGLAALALAPDEVSEVEAEVKYAGYIARQKIEVDRLLRMESCVIPHQFDYQGLPGMSNEAKTKLCARRPGTLGEASRVAGVTPNDLNLLLVCLNR